MSICSRVEHTRCTGRRAQPAPFRKTVYISLTWLLAWTNAACSDLRDGQVDGYVLDAAQSAMSADVIIPTLGRRVLFSRTGGYTPVTGGEVNLSFLTLTARFLGFDTFTMSVEGEGRKILETNGITAIDDIDIENIDQVYHVPDDVAEPFMTSLAAWRKSPRTSDLRLETLALFDQAKAWVQHVGPQTNAKRTTSRGEEIILYRALQIKRVVDLYHIDTMVVPDNARYAIAALIACAKSPTRVILYAQSTPRDQDDQLYQQELEVMAVSWASALRFDPPSEVNVIENGVNLRRFARANQPVRVLRHHLAIPESAFVIGHTGYINSTKNQISVVQAALAIAEVRADVHVIFAGAVANQDYYNSLIAFIDRHGFGDHVHFLGRRDDMDAVLKELDMFVFPSRDEGFGLGLAEAMASEVPAIASDLGAFHEFVGDTVSLVAIDDGGTQIRERALELLRDATGATRRATRSRQQLIELGLHTDRMAREFAVLLGAKINAPQPDATGLTPL